MRVTGAGVLDVTCPELRGADQRCARADAEDGWLVERLTMASALVLVQLDLLQA